MRLAHALAVTARLPSHRQTRPEAALELFRKAPQDFALVLTDLTMPGMTGLELAQQLLELQPSARIALMSGFSGTWTPASVRTLGLIDMLVKPLSAAALAQGVARALLTQPQS